MPENVRKDFQTLVNNKFDVAVKQYENLRGETARKINIKTGTTDGVDYLTDYAGVMTGYGLPPEDINDVGDIYGVGAFDPANFYK